MINTKKKTILTSFILTGTVIIILSIAQSFRGFNSTPSGSHQPKDTSIILNHSSYLMM